MDWLKGGQDDWFFEDWYDSYIGMKYAKDYGPPTFEDWTDNRTIYNPLPGTDIDKYILLSVFAYILYKVKKWNI